MLCRAFQRPVAAIVRKWLPRREDREDCVQEILLRMLIRLSTWQGRAPFCHWMNTVARRCAIDWLRRKTWIMQLEHVRLVPDRVTPPPDTKEELKEKIRRLRAALANFRPDIRPKVRRACMLRRRGMDWNEVADRLGVSVSTVHNWMRQLREWLGPPHEW
jgi:RNA polymerase sigma-70 factor (ECF subfamily)